MQDYPRKLKLDSGNLAFASHLAEEKTLTIGFKNGSVYEYAEVPEDLFFRFTKAKEEEPYLSYGKFFHKEIRGKFQDRKVKDADPKPEVKTDEKSQSEPEGKEIQTPGAGPQAERPDAKQAD